MRWQAKKTKNVEFKVTIITSSWFVWPRPATETAKDITKQKTKARRASNEIIKWPHRDCQSPKKALISSWPWLRCSFSLWFSSVKGGRVTERKKYYKVHSYIPSQMQLCGTDYYLIDLHTPGDTLICKTLWMAMNRINQMLVSSE